MNFVLCLTELIEQQLINKLVSKYESHKTVVHVTILLQAILGLNFLDKNNL